MLETIGALFSGPTWILISGAVVAGIAALGTLFYKADKGGYNRKKAEDLDAYEKYIEDLNRAANARPTGSLSNDPNNRDNR
jgi:hypothetical protein